MKQSFVKDIFSVFKSRFAVILFNLIKVSIVARVLGPELNGQLAIILTYPTLFIVIGSMGIRKSSAFMIAKSPNLKPAIYKSIIQFWILTATFCVTISIILLHNFTKIELNNNVLILAVIPIVFSLLNNYISGIYLGENQIKEFNKINWLPAFLNLTFVILFLLFFDYTVKGVLLSILISELLVSLLLIHKLKIFKYFSFKIEKQLILKMLSLGITFALALFTLNLNYRLDIIMMDYLSNNYETGLYSKASVLTQYLWQFPGLLGTIIFARGAATKDKLKFSIKCCRLLRISIVVVLLAALSLVVFGKWIINLLFGVDFASAIYVIYYILPGVILFTIFKVLNNDVSSRGKPLFIIPSMIFGIVINVISNYFLIPIYGGVGAAISSSISYSLAALIFTINYSKLTTIPLKEIFGYQKNDFQIVYSKLQFFKK